MLKFLKHFHKKNKVIAKPEPILISIYSLPIEIVSEILSFIEINEFMIVACTSKQFHQSMSTMYFWTQIYKKMGLSQIRPSEKPYHIPVLKFLKTKWDTQHTSQFLSVFDNATCVTRQVASCSNPAILAKRPLTAGSVGSHVTFQIISCGSWLSLGLATRDFKLDDDSVVGQQKECVGMYYHGPTKICGNVYLIGDCLTKINKPLNIKFKDSDRIRIDRKETEICFSYNDELYYTIENVVSDRVLWPCASLSYNSIVKLI